MKRRINRRSPLLLLILAVSLLQTGLLLAQEDLTFTSAADYDFGQKIRFYLTVTDVPEVETITLYLRAPEFPNAFSDNVTFTAADPLVVSHEIDLAQLRLAPFTTVTFWWQLTTAEGEDIWIPQRALSYEDNQFPWRQISREHVTVNWTGDDATLGQLAIDIIDEELPRLQTLVPVPAELSLRVYIYPTSADLRAALRLTGRDWVGAHAHPELGVILLTAVNPRTAASDLRQSIPHELVHHLLFLATGSNYDALPAWFNEGLATYVEPSPNPALVPVLSEAVSDQTTLPFSELCTGFPSSEAGAVLAYAQSMSLVHFIQGTFGARAVPEMIRRFAAGEDCDSAVNGAVGLSLAELNREWLRDLVPRSPIWQFLSDFGLWLILIGGGFGIMYLMVRATPTEEQRQSFSGSRRQT